MKMLGRGLVVLVLCALTAAGGWFYALHGQNEEHQVLSREGVLMQIKQMNRLESTAFYIDTIIRTEKKGIGAGCGRIHKAVFLLCAVRCWLVWIWTS